MKDSLREFALFLLRASVGLALLYHGWLKIDMGVDVFADKGITHLGWPFTFSPILFAWLATLAELVGGFFCFLGLWTRFAAFALVINMGVASFIALRDAPIISMSTPMTRELPMLYFVVFIAILILGPGRWSVDGVRGGSKRSSPKKKK
jgi:putative oxidoreductase